MYHFSIRLVSGTSLASEVKHLCVWALICQDDLNLFFIATCFLSHFLLEMESHRVLFWPTVILTGTNGSDYLDYHFISVLLFSRIFFANLNLTTSCTCLSAARNWLSANFLLPLSAKTEMALAGQAKSIHCTLSFDLHVKEVVRVAFFLVRKIAFVKSLCNIQAGLLQCPFIKVA